MVDRSKIAKALVIADRGYESFNSMAHIQEKNGFFLFRVKDGLNGIKNGLDLPETDRFDINISLKLTSMNCIFEWQDFLSQKIAMKR